MGLRATVIKTYKVEYGNTNGFNYAPEDLGKIIDHFCDCASTGGEYYDTERIWSVDKGQFAEMVKSIESMSSKEFHELLDEELCIEDVDDNGYTKKYVLNVFKGFLEETPEDSDWVRFGWL